MTQRRYGTLRLVIFVLQVLAWVSLILGLLIALGTFLTIALGLAQLPAPNQPAEPPTASLLAGSIGAVTSLIVTIILFVGFMATSQIIHLLIEMEQNTRISADALQRLLTLQFARLDNPVAAIDIAASPDNDQNDQPDTPIATDRPAEPTITTSAPPLSTP